MDFKLDENMPVEAAALLRDAGHDAVTVLEQSLGGATDTQLASVVAAESRILITLDTDFADIRAHPPGASPGIIVLRLRHHDKAHILEVIDVLIRELLHETPERQLWIVEESRIRVRAQQ